RPAPRAPRTARGRPRRPLPRHAPLRLAAHRRPPRRSHRSRRVAVPPKLRGVIASLKLATATHVPQRVLKVDATLLGASAVGREIARDSLTRLLGGSSARASERFQLSNPSSLLGSHWVPDVPIRLQHQP